MDATKQGGTDGKMDMEYIYHQYSLPLKKYIYSMCHDSDLSDDIVSETFYRAIKNIDSFYGGNMFTWLCTIAKHTYFNYTKKKETQNVSLEESQQVEPVSTEQIEDAVIQKERSMDLYKAMQYLESQERDVVYLRTFAELSFKEIGEVVGKSENWARVTYFRCKEKLKRRMSNA
ncbi:MAG: sigma-70 family RNA polymerase sigma factor [Eubacteriales bacterium]|nr:sigma-70 family RNA polymerase sigma factor [Eubacteriales bacterium]